LIGVGGYNNILTKTSFFALLPSVHVLADPMSIALNALSLKKSKVESQTRMKKGFAQKTTFCLCQKKFGCHIEFIPIL
jgi:hypothetical protein